MEKEITNLQDSWTATVYAQISHFRGKKGALNQVPQFVEAINREHARYKEKFRTMRDRKLGYGDSKLLEMVEMNVGRVAKDVIDMAETTGVEFPKPVF
jgi:hypothetical protein